MSTSFSLTLLPGDGIGPEIMAQARKVIAWLEAGGDLKFNLCEDQIGGAAYEQYGVPLADETLEKCRASDAILMGAVGGPQWNDVPYDKRPEAGLLRLRKELNLFANLRPAIVFDALVEASMLCGGVRFVRGGEGRRVGWLAEGPRTWPSRRGQRRAGGYRARGEGAVRGAWLRGDHVVEHRGGCGCRSDPDHAFLRGQGAVVRCHLGIAG